MNSDKWLLLVSFVVGMSTACACPPADEGKTTSTTDQFDSSGHVPHDVPVEQPGVGAPCQVQDDCMSEPGGLYCVPEHKFCSVSCVSDAECQHGIAGEACVGGWCGIPCDELSPYQCGLLGPSAVCIEAAGREMCGNP